MDRYCKRLIEVDLPVKRISKNSRSLYRKGKIASLHAWWARKPQSSCRAVICASLWPDPAHRLCPVSFRDAAKEEMERWANINLKLLSVESQHQFISISKNKNLLSNNMELRNALLDFITDFSLPVNATDGNYLKVVRYLTKIAHIALSGVEGTKPLLVDPFAGGGSIPIEALRVGANAYSSDINPIAVLLNKVIVEYVPKLGDQLLTEIKKWVNWIKDKAYINLAKFYPSDPDGSIPMYYIWARVIKCEGPSCGTIVPMKSTMWLAQKKNRKIALSFNANQQTKTFEYSSCSKSKES